MESKLKVDDYVDVSIREHYGIPYWLYCKVVFRDYDQIIVVDAYGVNHMVTIRNCRNQFYFD